MATKKKTSYPQRGNVYLYRSAHYVLTGTSYISRGRQAGTTVYHIAPMIQGGKYYGMKVYNRGIFPLSAPTKKFTKAQISKALEAYTETKEKIVDRKKKIAQKNLDKLGDIDFKDCKTAQGISHRDGSTDYRTVVGAEVMKIGDAVSILYRGRFYPTTEKLVAINWKTGKIAIASPFTKTRIRWIPARQVVAVNGKSIK